MNQSPPSDNGTPSPNDDSGEGIDRSSTSSRKPSRGANHQKGGRQRYSRRTNKLVQSLGTLFTQHQVSHLDGLSDTHIKDVADSRRRKRPNELAVDLAELALLRPDRVSEIERALAEDRLTEAFFRGKGDHPELIQNYWFGDAGAGFKSLRDNHPGTAVSLPGAKWVQLIQEADAVRHIWRDSGGKTRKSEALQDAIREGQELNPEGSTPRLSGQLRKIYARIPPWVGGVAGRELSPTKLQECVEVVSKAFSKETGYRVLAANVHRESMHDLHIHLVFTELVPAVQKVSAYKPETLEKMLRNLRNGPAQEALVASGNLKPKKAEKEAQLELMFESGELDDPRKGKRAKNGEFEYQRQSRHKGGRDHVVAMGPAYVSKTWLWETSGRSAQVAMINEQENHFLNFRSVVIEAAKRYIAPRNAKNPEDVYIDYWLSKKWTEAVMERISESGKMDISREATASVDRYVDSGRSLPEPFSEKELQLRARKLKEAEEIHAAAVRVQQEAEVAIKAAEEESTRIRFAATRDAEAVKSEAARILSEAEEEVIAAKETIKVLEDKAKLWDRAQAMFLRALENFTEERKQEVIQAAAKDDPKISDDKVMKVPTLFSRLAKMVDWMRLPADRSKSGLGGNDRGMD